MTAVIDAPPEQETPECQCAICIPDGPGLPSGAYRPHLLTQGCWCRVDPAGMCHVAISYGLA